MVKLSIVIAIYNVEKYLNICLDSFLNQSNKNFELILVNDGSTDNSKNICNEYSHFPFIKVIHQKNLGVSEARNTGITAATGNWITFVDGDDFVENNFVESILKCIEKNSFDMLIFDYKGFYNSNRKFECKILPIESDRYISKEKNFFQKKMISQYYNGGSPNSIVSSGTTWCKVIKKEILINNSLTFKPGLIKAQDTVFWLNSTEYVTKIYYLGMSLYNYRLSASSISSGKKYIKNSEFEFSKLLSEYYLFIKKFNKDNSYYNALNLRIIQVIMWNIDHNFFNKRNKLKISDRSSSLITLINKEIYRNAINNVNCKLLPKRLRVLHYFIKSNYVNLYFYVYRIYDFLSSIKNRRV
ncbi:glycosyltransferase [Facklamia hominis]|uniref:Glycosyltransferase 2-like domain-containing protein n=1 Tax=Facklamia hominis CCUG 36813 TaxID=883111 RepID=K1LI28_9LACT|nr:glycosyltransferase [Facklamia hominis]EKB56320.1 hypothetical protein HMPREF9706_00303 [Facklamia hominis CCUG 36813]RYC97363.1 glycosyltransferase [Facklamia hominis]